MSTPATQILVSNTVFQQTKPGPVDVADFSTETAYTQTKLVGASCSASKLGTAKKTKP